MTSKTFVHAKLLRDRLDVAEYNDNTPVSSSPNFSQVTIENWQNVKLTDQTLIIADALTSGYTAID